jgi:hypothetical protein
VLTIVGGTFTDQLQVSVTTVSSGVITGVSVITGTFGIYTQLPSNPVSVTGGTGTGATFSTSWNLRAITVDSAGSGYVEQPTITFSGGGGSGAAAFATVGSGTTIKSLGSTMSLSTASGEQVRIAQANPPVNYLQMQGNSASSSPILSVQGTDTNIGLAVSSKGNLGVRFFTNNLSNLQLDVTHTASAVNYVQVSGAATGGGVVVGSQGSDTNVNINYWSKGNSAHIFATGSSYTQQFIVNHTASAVNYVQVTGNTTGNRPYFITGGSDTNISFAYSAKGTGAHDFYTNGFGFAQQFRIAHTASTVNYLQVTGSATGNAVQVLAVGTDTNIPLVLQPKGTGALQAQQTDSTATGGNARGTNAVDWQMSRGAASSVASGTYSVVGGGASNGVNSAYGGTLSGVSNNTTGFASVISGGWSNSATGGQAAVVGGYSNSATGAFNFIGGGTLNSGTANAAVTTQSATMNGTTAVTLSASNANIKVGQYITGTSISFNTYVAAVSGTSLTLSQAAGGSSTSTISFFTPYSVVVGGGSNTATGSYSFIGGGGDAGNFSNRNVASGDWSVVCGGHKNTASGIASFVGGGGISPPFGSFPNTASSNAACVVGGFSNTASNQGTFIGSGYQNIANGVYSAIMGGSFGTARAIIGNHVFPACSEPMGFGSGLSQAAMLVLARQTTDATPTVLASTSAAVSNINQVILPNNSAYFFTGEVVAGVTGGGNTKGWTIEGVIKRGANAASTALVGTPTVTSTYADAGASTWVIAVTADTTNGGLAVTFTGQASTTIRTVAKISTVEMTY